MSQPAYKVQLRLIVPQALVRAGVAVYLKAVEFFADRGQRIFPQEKLLELSKSLPVIVEGEVTADSFEQFLCSFPDIDKIVILTSTVSAQSARAAA